MLTSLYLCYSLLGSAYSSLLDRVLSQSFPKLSMLGRQQALNMYLIGPFCLLLLWGKGGAGSMRFPDRFKSFFWVIPTLSVLWSFTWEGESKQGCWGKSMMERCDGGYYMYLPSWRVIYTSRTLTIAVWGERGEEGGGNHVCFSLSSLFSLLLSLSPLHHLLIFLLGNITIKPPRRERSK